MELMRKHHKVELEQMIELQLHETQALNSQFEKTRQLLNDQQQQLVAKIREWEQVYARRDSRMEDLHRIADLEHGTDGFSELLEMVFGRRGGGKRRARPANHR